MARNSNPADLTAHDSAGDGGPAARRRLRRGRADAGLLRRRHPRHRLARLPPPQPGSAGRRRVRPSHGPRRRPDLVTAAHLRQHAGSSGARGRRGARAQHGASGGSGAVRGAVHGAAGRAGLPLRHADAGVAAAIDAIRARDGEVRPGVGGGAAQRVGTPAAGTRRPRSDAASDSAP